MILPTGMFTNNSSIIEYNSGAFNPLNPVQYINTRYYRCNITNINMSRPTQD